MKRRVKKLGMCSLCILGLGFKPGAVPGTLNYSGRSLFTFCKTYFRVEGTSGKRTELNERKKDTCLNKWLEGNKFKVMFITQNLCLTSK